MFLPDELAPKGAVSATFGRFFNSCPRSAAFYQLHRRTELSASFLEKGSALHRVLELATLAAIEQEEEMVPPELVKAILDEVFDDPEYRTPIEFHDYLRESAYRWAEQTMLRANEVVAVETLMSLDLGPLKLRCKVDRAELFDGGARAEVIDYKSTRALPSQEDIGRKRDDDTIAPKDFQLIAYACAMVWGTPLRQEVDRLTGEVVEVPEPFELAPRAQVVDAAYVFPGIVQRDGMMGRRGGTFTRLELEAYRRSLEAFAVQVANSVEAGDWPASYGSHCVECPCPSDCPIPVELRDHKGTISTVEDAREAMERLAKEQVEHRGRRKEVTNFVKAQEGPFQLRFGKDQVLEVGYQEWVEIPDKPGFIEAARRAAELGVPLDEARWLKTRRSSPIVERKLSAAELEEDVDAED